MCLLMIPLATTELGTDAWIQGLMAPVLTGYELNPAMALVFSASIMLVLRMFAGSILKVASPPAMLCFSGVLSAVGLMWLSTTAGVAATSTSVGAHRLILSAGNCLCRPEEGISGRAQQLVLPTVGIPKFPREVSGRRGSCAFGTMNGIVSSSQTLQ